MTPGKQPATRRLKALQDETAALRVEERELGRQVQNMRSSIAGLSESVIQLRAAELAGQDVSERLSRAVDNLAQAKAEAASQEWQDELRVKALAIAKKNDEATRWALDNREALWSERAPDAVAVAEAATGAARALERALTALEAFASESGQLCSLTGGTPRYDMPLTDVHGLRRAIREFLSTGATPPLPRALPQPVVHFNEATSRDVVEIIGGASQ